MKQAVSKGLGLGADCRRRGRLMLAESPPLIRPVGPGQGAARAGGMSLVIGAPRNLGWESSGGPVVRTLLPMWGALVLPLI